MKNIILKSGLISGAVLGVLSAVSMPLCLSGVISFDKMEIVGYTAMVAAFLMVFFGIRRYRDTEGGGTITFGRAFKVGIGITIVACAVYVAAWEVVYWGFVPDFDDRYGAHVMESLRASGASAAELAAKQEEIATFKRLYANPTINAGITFMEVFPVGLMVTLVSALLLFRSGRRTTAGPSVAADTPGR